MMHTSEDKVTRSRPLLECKAFTLIEVLVVVAIIALLVAILMPSLKRVRDQARRAACASNLHQIGNGLVAYGLQNREKLPPTWTTYTNSIDVPNLAGFFEPRNPFGAPKYTNALQKYIGSQVWSCPANGKPPLGLANPVGEDAWFYPAGSDFKYGGTQYYLAWGVGIVDQRRLEAGSVPERQYPWAAPTTNEKDRRAWWVGDFAFTALEPSFHSSNHISMTRKVGDDVTHAAGGNFLFVDGHVEWFPLFRLTVTMRTRYDAGEFVALPPFETGAVREVAGSP